MTALRFELPTGEQAEITDHLLDRWREHVMPLASRVDAARLLDQYMQLVGVVRDAPPTWFVGGTELAEAWIVAGDFVVPIVRDRGRLYCPTVIARGSLPESERRARNVRGQIARAIRATRRRRTAAQSARSGDRRRRRELLAPGLSDQDAG